MSTTAPLPITTVDHASHEGERPTRLLTRHPVAAFVTVSLGIGWLSLGAAVALDLPLEPFLLLANFGGLLGTALVITGRISGRAGVRSLLSGVVRWRVGWGWWALALGSLPATTLAIAAATGTLHTPEGEWSGMVVAYATGTLLVGALVFNLWEEVAWAGFVQTRLARRYGVLGGAALTAIPFAAIHLPLAFVDDPSTRQVAITIAVLFLIAIAFRTLAGTVLDATGGSILVVAVMHASFNASGQLTAVQGQWQGLVALVVLTIAVVVLRRLWLTSAAPAMGHNDRPHRLGLRTARRSPRPPSERGETRRARRIEDEILIDAPVQDVWDVLTDFAGHAHWNPFLQFDQASLEVGARLRVRVSPPGVKARTFTPTLVAAQPPARYEWLGHVGLPGILDARHRFELTETSGNQTRVHQEEVFTGLLAPFFPGLVARTEAGFRAMHQALKTRVQTQVTRQASAESLST